MSRELRILRQLKQCVEDATEVLSESDSGGEEILEGLLSVCQEALKLRHITPQPAQKVEKKRSWISLKRQAVDREKAFTYIHEELAKIGIEQWKFDSMLSKISKELEGQTTVMRAPISPSEKLAITLRFLTTGQTYTSLDKMTGLSKAFISHTVPEVCKAIFGNLKDCIKFPKTTEALKQIAAEFSVKCQFPTCIGAIGAKEIKGLRRNSVILLALVDANCSFMYVHVDSRSESSYGSYYLRSGLHQTLRVRKHFPAPMLIGQNQSLPYVIVGNESFPLQPHLMKPYSVDTEEFQSDLFYNQYVYNQRLQRATQFVECAFDALTKKFRVLDSGLILRVENVEIITLACCILHNFLIQCGVQIEVTQQPSETDTSTLQSISEDNNDDVYEDVRRKFVDYFNQDNTE